jgi:hypothetical protein
MYARLRYMTNNISCTSHSSDDSGLHFEIQGSQPYTVVFNTDIWTCTCPDFVSRNKWCKHIYYVLLMVLNMEQPPEDNSDATRYGHLCNFMKKRTQWFGRMCDPKIVYAHYDALWPVKNALD